MEQSNGSGEPRRRCRDGGPDRMIGDGGHEMPQAESVSGVPPVDVVVMAGSVNRIPLYPGNKPGQKALVELNGKPLIGYVLDALQAARGIDRIFVVGAPNVL